jgi:hypothetical protein
MYNPRNWDLAKNRREYDHRKSDSFHAGIKIIYPRRPHINAYKGRLTRRGNRMIDISDRLPVLLFSFRQASIGLSTYSTSILHYHAKFCTHLKSY